MPTRESEFVKYLFYSKLWNTQKPQQKTNPENPSYQTYLNSDVKYLEKISADFFHNFILSHSQFLTK